MLDIHHLFMIRCAPKKGIGNMLNSSMNFIEEVKGIPLLTVKREKELIRTIRSFKGGKQREKAIEELVKHNLRWAAKQAFYYSHRCSTDVGELYSAAKSGLVKAALMFDPKFKTRFSTYATQWIQQRIKELIYHSAPVKIPIHVVNGVIKHKKMVEENDGIDVTNDELKEELEITSKAVDKIRQAHISSISMNQPIGNGEEENAASFGDFIADEKTVSPDGNAKSLGDYNYLYEILDELDEISRDVVISQCLDADKTKLSTLGKKYGITGERIRQIREKALANLKKKLMIKIKHGEGILQLPFQVQDRHFKFGPPKKKKKAKIKKKKKG